MHQFRIGFIEGKIEHFRQKIGVSHRTKPRHNTEQTSINRKIEHFCFIAAFALANCKFYRHAK